MANSQRSKTREKFVAKQWYFV